MNNFLKKYKNDIILIFTVLSVALIGVLILGLTAKSGKTVKVLINGQEKYAFSLNKDTEKVIAQDKGENILIIKEGKAYIKSANCPDNICVSHRKISKVGETIVCLPNRVVIKVE